MWMLGLFSVLIILQGALRKWWLPGLSTPLYVAKDVALIGAVVLFGTWSDFRLPTPIKRTVLPSVWGLFAIVVIAQAFNFNFPTVIGSAVGVRSYLLYSLLLVLMPVAMEHVRRPERWIIAIALCIIVPVLLLGMYQYNQPLDAWINQYVRDDQELAAVAGRPRITGTFSYVGGMGAFLTFSLFFGLATTLAGLLHKHRWYKWVGVAVLGLAIVVAPMNGSRSVVLGALVPLPFVLYALFKDRRGRAAVVGLSILVLLAGYAIGQSTWASEGWINLEERATTASDRDTRITSMLTDPAKKLSVGGLFGYGTGATHQGAGALAPGGRIDIPGVYYEGEFGRVIVELGIVGGLLYLFLKVILAWLAWQALKRANNAWHTLLAVLTFSVVLLPVVSGMIVFNHINGAIYWLCAGIAVWLWSKQEVYLRHHRPQKPAR
ncbi:hypothetical protein CRI94_13955 [Longibacter salinarum]|uniref:Ligase n=2 Tax=Longibacter salinarum TaxID=1850348 RepID=A0A2A8CV80_9BACT|nr:hypothetical protein CRI94_13955 [Longibacter salinarum]